MPRAGQNQKGSGEAIVRIWWFGSGGNFFKSMGLGHGSVEVIDLIQGQTKYMTWASSDDPTRNSGELSYSLASDKNAYGRNNKPRDPDQTWSLPLRNPQDVLSCGLDGKHMIEWWRNFKASTTNYRLLSKEKNCDAVTVNALIAGGADSYAKLPAPWFVMSAAELNQWIPEVRQQIIRWQDHLDAARNLLQQKLQDNLLTSDNLSLHNALTGNNVPTVAEWKRKSSVRIGRRREQILHIDKLLDEYWRVGAGNLTPWQMNVKKRIILTRILHHVYLHLLKKPTSSRRDAVIYLGVLVINAMKHHDQNARTEYKIAYSDRYGGPELPPAYDISLPSLT